MKLASTLAVNSAKCMGRRSSFDGTNAMTTALKRRASLDASGIHTPIRRSSYTYVRSTVTHEHFEENFPFHFEQHRATTQTFSKSSLSKENIYKILEHEPKPSVSAKEMPCEIVFLGGAPGAGKGTNSLHIAEVRGHSSEPIVVSSLLDTPECRRLKDQGKMVDDAFVFDLLMKEIQKPAYRNGVVVDGFPRTAQQAKLLTDLHQDFIESEETPPQYLFVMLHVSENASIERQLSRGELLKQQNEKRVQDGLEALELRATDTSYASAKGRYTVFEEQLSAVMDLGKKFQSVIIDASSTIDNVRNAISQQMSVLPKLL